MNEMSSKEFNLDLPEVTVVAAEEPRPPAPMQQRQPNLTEPKEHRESQPARADKPHAVRQAARRIVPSPRLIDNRPWGKFEQYALNETCSVKIITVHPEEQLSLQSHTLRDELWVVLDEAMDVELNGQRMTIYQGEEVFIPIGTKHRVWGLDKPCRWLEIAFGTFDEDDITRYEDKYGR